MMNEEGSNSVAATPVVSIHLPDENKFKSLTKKNIDQLKMQIKDWGLSYLDALQGLYASNLISQTVYAELQMLDGKELFAEAQQASVIATPAPVVQVAPQPIIPVIDPEKERQARIESEQKRMEEVLALRLEEKKKRELLEKGRQEREEKELADALAASLQASNENVLAAERVKKELMQRQEEEKILADVIAASMASELVQKDLDAEKERKALREFEEALSLSKAFGMEEREKAQEAERKEKHDLQKAMALSLAMAKHLAEQQELEQQPERKHEEEAMSAAASVNFNDNFFANLKANTIRWNDINQRIIALKSSASLNDEQIIDRLFQDGILTPNEKIYFKKISPREFLEIAKYIETNKEVLFSKAREEGSVRVYRKQTKLPTFALIYSQSEGGFSLYLRPNSKKSNYDIDPTRKLSESEKIKAVKSGSSKVGKRHSCLLMSAYPPVPQFRLRSKDNNLNLQSKHPFEEEANNAAQFGHYVAAIKDCNLYQQDGKVKAEGYSEEAVGPLNEFIGHNGFKDAEGKNACELDRIKLIKCMALGLASMHKKNYVHQDIKPENILIYQVVDPVTFEIRLEAKVADLGLGKNLSSNNKVLEGTFEYASPELFIGCSDKQDKCHKYFHQKHVNNYYSLGFHYYRELFQDNPARSQLRSINIDASKANDIWSLGITAYRILFGSFPHLNNQEEVELFKKRVRDYPLLGKMLDPNPNRRIAIERLLIELDAKIDELKQVPRRLSA